MVKKRLSYRALKIAQRVFNGRTICDVFDQSQGPFLLIFNVRDQNDVFDQCQGPFVIKTLLLNINLLQVGLIDMWWKCELVSFNIISYAWVVEFFAQV